MSSRQRVSGHVATVEDLPLELYPSSSTSPPERGHEQSYATAHRSSSLTKVRTDSGSPTLQPLTQTPPAPRHFAKHLHGWPSHPMTALAHNHRVAREISRLDS